MDRLENFKVQIAIILIAEAAALFVLYMAVQEISGKLNDFIEENPHLKNIILLVDMGSLEGIGEVIADSVNVGVINNISTSLALNIGMKIQQHYELENLLETACAENQCNYKVLSEAKKEKAIVFTNEIGRAHV